jgi:hypothetical protein
VTCDMSNCMDMAVARPVTANIGWYVVSEKMASFLGTTISKSVGPSRS